MTLRNQTQHQLYHDQHLYVDLRYELVILDGHTLTLTRTVYGLLVVLVQHAEEAMSRETLSMRVWGHLLSARSRTVDTHVRGLRRKLGVPGEQHIETAPGVGYRFRAGSRPGLSYVTLKKDIAFRR